MSELAERFKSLLYREDKRGCVELVLRELERGATGIVPLYTEVLGPALNDIGKEGGDDPDMVWKEHVRSSIVRTVIECCYPYVLKERDRGRAGGEPEAGGRTGRKAGGRTGLVVCPEEEYHDIGARMVADFFTLLGFETHFVGANTPARDIASGFRVLRPRFVAVSVSSAYNIVAAERAVRAVREESGKAGSPVRIIVGGRALRENPGLRERIGADLELQTFKEMRKWARGVR